jgi:hypothetical protein
MFTRGAVLLPCWHKNVLGHGLWIYGYNGVMVLWIYGVGGDGGDDGGAENNT